MSDLFAARAEETASRAAPLATRMRPRTLDDVVGQKSLLDEGAAFRRLVESGHPVSMLLWGPPGTGKTTLARLIASYGEAEFETLSATSAGVKDIREVLSVARSRLELDEKGTVLFLDEIHRFAKNQQDALLPGVEDGTLVLIGATTENPFFEVNSPLMSRMTLFRLEGLAPSDVEDLIDRALEDEDRGLGVQGLTIEPMAREVLASRTGGDARQSLNALEVAALLASGEDRSEINADDVGEALQRRIVRYDKGGDQHYDVVSAFIKSVRGSDPDAALYWLFMMLEGGEDPEFIARRLIILASEDIGLADSAGLGVAVSASEALAYVGLPEAAYHLAHATLYLSTAPKSNSVGKAMSAARDLVTDGPVGTVPAHLKSSGISSEDRSAGYLYAHDYEGNVVAQQYFPDGVDPRILFRAGENGDEADLAERLAEIDRRLGREGRG